MRAPLFLSHVQVAEDVFCASLGVVLGVTRRVRSYRLFRLPSVSRVALCHFEQAVDTIARPRASDLVAFNVLRGGHARRVLQGGVAVLHVVRGLIEEISNTAFTRVGHVFNVEYLNARVMNGRVASRLLRVFPSANVRVVRLQVRVNRVRYLSVDVLAMGSVLEDRSIAAVVSASTGLLTGQQLTVNVCVQIFLRQVSAPFLARPDDAFPLLSAPIFRVIELTSLVTTPS